MSKVIVNSHKEFETYIGKEMGISDYLEITQDRINLFAEATLDYQWIHTDPNRAKIESPFHSTIAHGYLTLSLVPHLLDQVVAVNNTKMTINYGIEKLRFNQPVLVEGKIRIRVALASLVNLRGVSKAEIKFGLEIEGSTKTALEGIIVYLYHFNE